MTTKTKARKARGHGETWDKMRRVFIKYPLVPVADLARLFGVSRAAFYKNVSGLVEERESLRQDALNKLRDAEGL
jgi:hypothetical protein